MKEKKPNILFLSGWYPNRIMPTLGNFVQKHAEAASLHANVAAVTVTADPGCKSMYETETATINNVFAVNVYYKKITHRIPLISQAQKAIRFIRASRKGFRIAESKLGRIDLVHENILFPTGFVALLIKKFHGIPYIITEHSTAYSSLRRSERGMLERIVAPVIARNASLITTVSADLRDAMQECGIQNKFEIINNVTDTRLFRPAKKSGKFRFLHISTLDDHHKNISGMLNAVKFLSKKQQDFEVLFAGDGDTRPHVETAKRLGIMNSIVFLEGTKTTAEVAELMQSADCFLLYSRYENFPCVIVEALASGIPVVSSSVGGIAEHVGNDNGILVKGNEHELAEAMAAMIQNVRSGKYDPQKLSSYAFEHFSYEKVGERFGKLYQRILAGK
jgi:glycosyltransferase involved in cell wall biosynthesis